MKTRTISKATGLLMVMMMFAGSLLAAPPTVRLCECTAQSEDRNFPAEASQLLKEIRSNATQLTRTAAMLESFGRVGVSWQSHAQELTLAKQHINTIGERLAQLQEMRHLTAPWQQTAVDSMHPIAVSLAGRIEIAISHLNANQRNLSAPAYTGHIGAISDHADQFKEHVDLHLDLASAHEKLEELRNRAAALGT